MLVFDVGGVVEGVVHIPVAVGVRDALDGPCSRFPQGNSGISPLDNQDEEVLLALFLGRLFLFPLVDTALQTPDDKAHDRARNTHSRDKSKHYLAQADVYFHWISPLYSVTTL